MSNTNQNPNELAALVQRISQRASAEGLHMRSLGDYANQIRGRRGQTMLDAIVLNFANRLGAIADCLVLQTDEGGRPRVVYVVGAETAESTRLDLTDDEYQQVLEVFRETPIPLSVMSLVLGPDGFPGTVSVQTLNPAPADDEEQPA